MYEQLEDGKILIWPQENTRIKKPAELTIYKCENKPADNKTVLIFPGGGYSHLAYHEGEPVAKAFNEYGFHAGVVKYSLAPKYKHPQMINDAQRAMRILRSGFANLGVGQGKIAALGFSAGGHLVSTLAVHHDKFVDKTDNLAPSTSARPDCAVLCYPVIDMAGESRHTGSCKNLLGENPAIDLMEKLSTQKHVTKDTPPVFLWHTADDSAVAAQNSLSFFSACRKNEVPTELHIFESGRHGLGLAKDNPPVDSWLGLSVKFLNKHLIK